LRGIVGHDTEGDIADDGSEVFGAEGPFGIGHFLAKGGEGLCSGLKLREAIAQLEGGSPFGRTGKA
jgi:hypothetical protein